MANRAFWKGRRVFLTGHTGFKGSWLSLWLEALGALILKLAKGWDAPIVTLAFGRSAFC